MDLGSLPGGLSDDESDQIQDMLGALLGGSQPGGAPNQNAPQGDEVLGTLSGGLGGTPMMGNADAGGGGMPAGGADLSGLLGALMGGGADARGAPGADPMMGMLGGLLGGVMGGGATSTGGAGTNPAMNAALAPLADMLAQKLNIPRDVAMAAMAIVVPMIMNKVMNSGRAPGDDPLGGMGRSVQPQSLKFSREDQEQMVSQLSAQTGLDKQAAAQTLNEAVQVLGSQQ